MICIVCHKEIKDSYADDFFVGNYCLDCATKLGYTPEQIANQQRAALEAEKTKQTKELTQEEIAAIETIKRIDFEAIAKALVELAKVVGQECAKALEKYKNEA